MPASVTEVGEKNHRNTGLERRRDKMACRYYFHVVINRKRYDDCLAELDFEFDLQPNTIVKELQTRLDYINKLQSSKTTTADLRKLYPFYNWVSKLL